MTHYMEEDPKAKIAARERDHAQQPHSYTGTLLAVVLLLVLSLYLLFGR